MISQIVSKQELLYRHTATGSHYFEDNLPWQPSQIQPLDFLTARRPDVLWLGADRIVSLEVDEHSHRERTTSCELGKMHDQFVAWQKLVGCVPVFYVRFNPDEFDGERTSLEDRVHTVARRVNKLLTMDVTDYTSLVPHVEFFYYHSNAQHHIDGVKSAPDSFVCVQTLEMLKGSL